MQFFCTISTAFLFFSFLNFLVAYMVLTFIRNVQEKADSLLFIGIKTCIQRNKRVLLLVWFARRLRKEKESSFVGYLVLTSVPNEKLEID